MPILRHRAGRGHVIEGHVPEEALKRLLAERPVGAGLAVGADDPRGSMP